MNRRFAGRPRIRPSHMLLCGVLSSAISSICCVGPFFLLVTGISGVSMSRVMILEPYQPIFAVASLACVFKAGWLLWRPKTCDGVPLQQSIFGLTTGRANVFLLSLLAIVILLTSEYWILWIAE